MSRGTVVVLALLGLGVASASFAAWAWRQRPARPSPSPFAPRPKEQPRRDVLGDWRARFDPLPEVDPARRTWQAVAAALGSADASARAALRQAALAEPGTYSPLLEEALHDERDAVRGHARELLLEMLQDPERRRAVLGERAGR